ncbi:glycosyltransferase [Actinomyces sp. MRS3W]|uniref:glycosyltransferase n=1 Tax=Actinomyces sp. MRS3W TaxID=2800796 RepID=UPI0028FD755B|nr:glycosyltransferase [Actinomyces sp. MRS3W]MDU0347792.1 glycosyltransferase [Actinomyces sp. MRS3W]
MKPRTAALATAAVGAGALALAAVRRRAHTGRPRVVLATRLYAPEAAAAALRLRGLARALADAGADVTVLTSTPPGMSAPADPGVTVHSAPALRDKSGYIRGYAQYLSFDIPLAARLLAGPAPDLMVAEPPPTTGAVVRVAAALRGAPYAYYAADVWSDAAASTGAPGWVVTALRAVESLVLRGAGRVLAVNDGVAERVRELGAREVTVVPNGIDTEVFTPDGARAAAAPTVPYFLYAGTASEWQGAGIFIHALRRLHEVVPEARLVFLGQGSDWQALRDLAGGDARVEFHDLVPAAEAAAWQRGAVASVVSIRPGLGYDFAYPTKIFAALACGTPVVYAGPGPARTDLPANDLGWAGDYDVEQVAASMLAALRAAQADDGERARAARRRRDWVMRNRSMQAALGDAAAMLLAD